MGGKLCALDHVCIRWRVRLFLIRLTLHFRLPEGLSYIAWAHLQSRLWTERKAWTITGVASLIPSCFVDLFTILASAAYSMHTLFPCYHFAYSRRPEHWWTSSLTFRFFPLVSHDTACERVQSCACQVWLVLHVVLEQ